MLASGYVPTVQIGEPKTPPPQGISAAIMMGDVGVYQTTLSTTIERHGVVVRFYVDMLAEPTEQNELALAQVVTDFMGDLAGDFDLGGTIRQVDIAGVSGSGLAARWAYIDAGGKMYRVADVQVAFIVNDGSSLVA